MRSRTHLALGKDPPMTRPVTPPSAGAHCRHSRSRRPAPPVRPRGCITGRPLLACRRRLEHLGVTGRFAAPHGQGSWFLAPRLTAATSFRGRCRRSTAHRGHGTRSQYTPPRSDHFSSAKWITFRAARPSTFGDSDRPLPRATTPGRTFESQNAKRLVPLA